MINFDLLKKAMEDSGMPTSTIAERCGIDRGTFYNRLNHKGEFKVSEIQAISVVLGLTPEQRDAIFFDQECD